jgi:transposase
VGSPRATRLKQDRQARGEAAAGGLDEDQRAELARLRRENAELFLWAEMTAA